VARGESKIDKEETMGPRETIHIGSSGDNEGESVRESKMAKRETK
jgi:hypothetical protein